MANERLYEDMEPREKFEALWLKAELHKRPGADALLYDLEKRGFFDLPASIKHHSNRFGGLATHTVNVADAAKPTTPLRIATRTQCLWRHSCTTFARSTSTTKLHSTSTVMRIAVCWDTVKRA